MNEIKCDNCGIKLNKKTRHPAIYGLRLEAVNYAEKENDVVFPVAIIPPIERPLDFCGFDCLEVYVNLNNDRS